MSRNPQIVRTIQTFFGQSKNFPDNPETLTGQSRNCLDNPESVQTIQKLSGQSRNFPDNSETELLQFQLIRLNSSTFFHKKLESFRICHKFVDFAIFFKSFWKKRLKALLPESVCVKNPAVFWLWSHELSFNNFGIR